MYKLYYRGTVYIFYYECIIITAVVYTSYYNNNNTHRSGRVLSIYEHGVRVSSIRCVILNTYTYIIILYMRVSRFRTTGAGGLSSSAFD